MIIVNCSNSGKLARTIAGKLKAKYSKLTISSFPDGDMYMKFNCSVKRQTVVIVQSFSPNSNQSLLEVVFAAETAKDLGARRVVLVAPYLAFMRQDKRFHPGEAVSSRVMAKLVNSSFDKIVTVDPHLHRYKSMKDIFTISARKITANPVIAQYIKKNFKNEIIIGPDWESYQWAESIAKQIHVSATVLKKTRFSSRRVKVKMVSPISVKGKNVVIVDDIISTGHTVAEAAKQARKMGAKKVYAVCVHGLFVEGAISKLARAGVKRIISTNTIEHPTNGIDISGAIIKGL